MQTSGYSGTPLAKKLGIKEGYTILLQNQPKHYFGLFVDFPKVSRVVEPTKESVDFIHFFETSNSRFENDILEVIPFLKKTGILWVSWPKGKSVIETDLSRDIIRVYLLNNGLVDVKVCAVDEDWSGLKFMYRVKDRN